MKTLRFIGMALMAVILTAGFTACSSDDDDNNGGAGETQQTSNTKLWYAYNPGTEKYGFINENGSFAIPAKYDHATNFSCGLARVETGGKYYFIDTNGKMINATGFDNAQSFANNYAAVKKDGVWGLIDKSGNFVIQPLYYSLGRVATNGLLAFRIQSGGKYGFINTNGDRVIDPEYDDVKTFNNGVACVRLGSKWGAINAEGKWVIQPIYESLKPITGKDMFIFGEKPFKNYGSTLYGIMDHNGNKKVQESYSSISDNKMGIGILAAKVYTGKWGYIDTNGNTVVPFKYDSAGDFYGDYAVVGIKESDNSNKYTYSVIDRSWIVDRIPKIRIVYSLYEKASCEDIYNGMILVAKDENGKKTYTYHRLSDNKIIYTWTE